MHESENICRTDFFPLFFCLSGHRTLVAGAGPVGTRRASLLAEFGAEVIVAAPEGSAKMRRLEQEGKILWRHREFEEGDLEGCFLVAAATSDEAVNDEIAEKCRRRGIFVNHAGNRKLCDFYFPAVAKKGKLVIGITASGQDHKLVRRFAALLREWLGTLDI